MIVRRLAAPIGPALTKAATDLAAAPVGSAEEWILPTGAQTVAAGLSLDLKGRSVRLRGDDTVKISFAAGGLSITGGVIEVIDVAIDAAAATSALQIKGVKVALTDVTAGASLPAGVVTVDLASDGAIDVEDLVITRAAGGDAIGVRAIGGSVRVTNAQLSHITGANVIGAHLGATADAEVVELEVDGATGTGTTIGAIIAAAGRIEVARIKCQDLGGAGVTGIAVLGYGAGNASVSVVDADAERLTATARATGIYVAAPRALVTRGFTVANVVGARATGAIVVGGSAGGAAGATDVEVGFGTIDRVVASAGDAAGLRVITMPSPRPVIVRDIAVAEVAGAPVPVGPIPPRASDGEPSWQEWGAAALADLADDGAPRNAPPALVDVADVVGLAVTTVVDDVEPFLDELDAGDLAVFDSTVHIVSGSVLQLETGLRPAWIRRCELSTGLRAGFVQADQLVIANTTWDRLGAPLVIGPGEVRAFDSIFTRVAGSGGPLSLDPDADWGDARALFSDTPTLQLADIGALPYVLPGSPAIPAPLLAGALPPPEAVDLRLVASSRLPDAAVAPPPDDLELGIDDRLFVGAYPPDAPARCKLYDPLPPAHDLGPTALAPSPVVDYRARDAKSLLALMLARANQVMKPWLDRGAADFTTMVLETVAERLDQIAYQQERAASEGFLDDAHLRRSVEDHVRPLDYQMDPGLSATVMVRFALDLAALADVISARETEAAITTDAARKAFLQATVAALKEIADDGALEVPAGTLVANARDDDQVIVFATEEPLAYFPELAAIKLVGDVAAGATSAKLALAAKTAPKLLTGRWLVLSRGPGKGGHVVRVTSLDVGTDTVAIGWDPRRPLPWPLPAGTGIVLGNVVPAHHGVPLSALPDGGGNADFARFEALLKMPVSGGRGIEVPLPFGPISVIAPSYPFPDGVRRGLPAIRVLVEDDEWERVDDLSTAGAGDEVFVLRSAADGRATIRFGDGVSGAALPERANQLRLDVAIGTGAVGNVGEGILTRLLYIPVDASRGPVTGWLYRESSEVLRSVFAVDNPLAAIGGREPETIDHARYHAPLRAREPVSAVTTADYERVAESLAEVSGAHARLITRAVRPIVHVTVLLRDQDALDEDEVLRRWADVRAALEHARLLGYDVESSPPIWAPLDIDIVVDAERHADAGVVHDSVVAAVAGNGGLLDPDTTRLGGDVQLADVYRSVLGVAGVASARVRRFRRLRQHAPERLTAGFIQIDPDEVATVRGPARPGGDGVLTVTVCGGLR